MKISKYLALGLLVISLTPVWGQFNSRTVVGQPVDPSTGLPTGSGSATLTKFNLDFPGGPPSKLVELIKKAAGKPLNVIIPNEYAQEDLPPLKMNNVDAPQLFQALEMASVKVEPYVTSRFQGGASSYSQLSTSYGFKTDARPVTDDSIWYFYGRSKVGKTPSEPPPIKTVRFYQLAPYLERGLTVDDITTAIQTGWKMEGPETPPEINFHKETKLLIAFGEPEKLEVIDNVLAALQPPPSAPTGFDERLKDIMQKSQQHSFAPPGTPQRIMPPIPMSPENPAADNKK